MKVNICCARPKDSMDDFPIGRAAGVVVYVNCSRFAPC